MSLKIKYEETEWMQEVDRFVKVKFILIFFRNSGKKYFEKLELSGYEERRFTKDTLQNVLDRKKEIALKSLHNRIKEQEKLDDFELVSIKT